jgi:hypothetical protein
VPNAFLGSVGRLAFRGRAKHVQGVFDQVQALASAPALMPPAVEASAGLPVDELAVARLEQQFRTLIPAYAEARTTEQPLAPVQLMVAASYAVTAMEQVLLQLASMPDSAVRMALYWYADLVPAAARDIGHDLLHYLTTGDAVHDVLHGLDAALATVWHNVVDPATLLQLAKDGLGILTQHEVPLTAVQHLIESGINVEVGQAFVQHLAEQAATHMEILAAEGTAHALVAAGDHISAMDAMHVHFPVITLARSLYTQVNLLNAGVTSLGDAATAVAIDTTAVMLGGAIGQALIPIPVLGAALGAMAARALAGEIKEQKLHELEAQLRAAVEQAPVKLQSAATEAARKLEPEWEAERRRFAGALIAPPSFAGTVDADFKGHLHAFHARVSETLDGYARAVQEGRALSQAGGSARGFVEVPEGFDLALQRAQAHLSEWQSTLPAETALQDHPAEALPALIAVAESATPHLQADVATVVHEQGQRVQTYHEAVREWMRSVTRAYNEAMARLAPQVEVALAGYNNAREAIEEDVKRKEQAVLQERRHLGKH